MNYHNITKDDLSNGEGIRAVLWVSGCSHYCKGCQNPVTWDPNDGLPFNEEAKNELWNYLDPSYCSGLTLSGGDPLYSGNIGDTLELLKDFRMRYGFSQEKTVWLYTGYAFEEVTDLTLGKCILRLIDTLVDGEYVEELRETSRHWVGSDNQVIWDRMPNTNLWVKRKKEYVTSLSDISKESCECTEK